MEITSSGMLLASLGTMTFALPYLLYPLLSKTTKTAESPCFSDWVSLHGLRTDRVQSWRNRYSIALDTSKNFLVYCRQGEYPTRCMIDLDEVDHVRIDSHFIKPSNPRDHRSHLDYLDLVFHFKNPQKLSKSIQIYEKSEKMPLADEWAIAKEWTELLQKRVGKRNESQSDYREVRFA